jgi:DNA (cytosine-5)-methyltransferase 1
MKYGSVCSGIEAASVAWHHLGWEPQWFSEIEQFPSEVLKHRFPDVPNLGDMTQLTQNPTFNERSIDLLVGGTPCQSFSVAGLRKGLADPRGNLMLTFLALADAKKPKWIVWENVPGVLSSNGGRDFGTFLGALGELGYGFAYRVLDAQYFGVAQRRRRVFVVGYLGDWRVAAAVLFERESLQGNIKPSRKKREEAATYAQGSVGEAGDVSCVGGNLSPTVTSKWKTGYGGPSGSNETGNMVYAPTIIDQSEGKWISPNGEETIGTIMARDYKGLGNQDLEDGRGLAIRPHAVAQPIAFEPGKMQRLGYGYSDNGTSPTLRSEPGDNQLAVAQPISIDAECNARTNQFGTLVRGGEGGTQQFVAQPLYYESHPQDSRVKGPKDVADTVSANYGMGGGNTPLVQQPIAVDIYNYTTNDHTTQTIRSQSDTDHIGAVLQPMAVDVYNQSIDGQTSATITEAVGGTNTSGPKVMHSMAIRRLTPKECERLQGFPDDWTKIPYRNKEADQCPDGPRYKACGNSMAVPVMRWIGQRIQYVENLMKEL